MTRDSQSARFTAATKTAHIGDPWKLLAASVIGSAVDDCRKGKHVLVDQVWPDLANVDVALLADEGIEVVA